MDALRGIRVLVTGATGFLGTRVVDQLGAQGADVHAINGRDVNAVARLAKAVDPQRVIHLAGFTDIGRSWTHADECFAANVGATVALLDAVRFTACERFVFASTADVYGDAPVPFREDGPVNPLSPYAQSKRAAELSCLKEGAVVVRPFNSYGPGQPPNRVVADVILTALKGQDVQMRGGTPRREFNFGDDTAAGIVAAATVDGLGGEVLNLGCGRDISIRELAELILGLMGDPVKAVFGVLDDRPVEVPVVVAATEKARRLLGWSPSRSLEEGLVETISWYRAQALKVDGR
ncbi:MAG: NAD-dependent epimerase/dehydratase family protein [Actinobacteria bacterium]|nr:NAD-dependent epimerase/dehydratase family protein [Actinomycetota bacterium]